MAKYVCPLCMILVVFITMLLHSKVSRYFYLGFEADLLEDAVPFMGAEVGHRGGISEIRIPHSILSLQRARC